MNANPPLPLLSVVIPMMNEAGNIQPLIEEIVTALRGYANVGERFEIICINDGSTDSTLSELRAARAAYPHVRILCHVHRLGMSASIRDAVRRARAEWVMTIDGDGQNDPRDMPRLCDLAWKSPTASATAGILVGGIRVNRRDTVGKRLASRCANAVRRWALHDDCPDTGCALKLFRRADYLAVPFFNGLHRFMPALFRHYGCELLFTPVNDRPRQHGVSKSDFVGRAVRGGLDLFGVMWLIRRTPSPDRTGVAEEHE